MPAPKESEFRISFPLDLGIDNTAQETAVQPTGEGAALVRSVNTRLNVVRGCPTKAPDFDSISTVGSVDCGGIVPAGNVDSAIAFFHPSTGNQRIAGSAVGDVTGQVTSTVTNSYWPASVHRSGALPGGQSIKPAAIAYDGGDTWVATLRVVDGSGLGDGALTVSLLGANDEVLVSPQVAHTFTTLSLQESFAITAHTDKAILWYRDPAAGSGDIFAREITRSGLGITIGSAQSIYVPHASGPLAMAVSSANATYAYIVCGNAVTQTSISVVRVTASTLATTASTFAVSAGSTDFLDIAHYVDSGVNAYVGVAIGQGTATQMIGLNAATMATLWGPTTSAEPFGNIVTAGFGEDATGTYHIFTISDADGTTWPSGVNGTYTEFRSVAGALTNTITWTPFMVPLGRPAPVRIATNDVYPMLAAQRFYSAGTDPADDGFLTDPSVELFRVERGAAGWTPVGRFGVDTAARRGNIGYSTIKASMNGAEVIYAHRTQPRAFMTYWEDTENALATGTRGWCSRYVDVDFDAGQPRYAHTANGAAIIAGAMPAQWDGSEVVEYGPMYRPVIQIVTTGGSAAAWSNGTYQIAALHVWRDANNVVHRSMPSAIHTVVGSGGTLDPIVYVAQPISVRDAVRGMRMETVLYATEVNGATLYAQRATPAAPSGFLVAFDDIDEPTALDVPGLPTLYSDGSATAELVAQCPPGFADVEVVGLRAWAIDAERPNVVWPSKLRDLIQAPNIAFEWNSDLRILFPAQAGKLRAVREFGGVPVFFSNKGLFTVTGPGPDNALSGDFNQPEQLSDQPCTDARSVVKTPAGVIFKSNNRYCIFNGQVRVFENVDAGTDDCVAAILLRDASEAVIVTSGSSHHVYNYALDRWTIWDSTCVPASTVACAYVPVTGAVLTFSTADIYRSDGETASDTAQMVFETGHIAPSGPQDDCVVNEIVLQGVKAGTHGLTVAIERDYGAGTVTRTYGAGDITACTVDGQYTLEMAPDKNSMRTIKLTVTETGATGEGMRPLSVTLVGHANPTTKKDAVRPRGRTPTGS